MEKTSRKVTVVIPVYNVEDYVESCVSSVLNQTYTDFELILVDDGATDSSGEICDKLALTDDRIRVIHQQNKGLGGARNTGIEESSTEYLFFLDSDDSIMPDTLKKLMETASDNKADIVIFGYLSVDEKGNTLNEFSNDLPKDKVMSPDEHPELFLAVPNAWNKLYKRELFTENNIRYPERLWYEDLHTTPKLMLHAKRVTVIGDKFYLYLIRSGSIMNNPNVKRNKEIMDAVSAIDSYFKKNNMREKFSSELEFLFMNNIYMAAVRVLKVNSGDSAAVLSELHEFDLGKVNRQNRYFKEQSFKTRLAMGLWQKKRYGLMKLIFRK